MALVQAALCNASLRDQCGHYRFPSVGALVFGAPIGTRARRRAAGAELGPCRHFSGFSWLLILGLALSVWPGRQS